jgi:hypothetical protein
VLISQCFPLESAEAINRYMNTYWSFIDISLAVSFTLVLFGFIRNRNRLVTASQYYFVCLAVLTVACIISIKFILLCFTVKVTVTTKAAELKRFRWPEGILPLPLSQSECSLHPSRLAGPGRNLRKLTESSL